MTNAKLHDQWIAYKKSNSVIIEAEIVGHDTASVLGQIDSIKTIWFHELDSFGQLREKGFIYEAKFSKSYGWTKTIDLRSIERGIYFYKVFSASTIIQTGKLTLIPY
jgi:hypothetical protein